MFLEQANSLLYLGGEANANGGKHTCSVMSSLRLFF